RDAYRRGASRVAPRGRPLVLAERGVQPHDVEGELPPGDRGRAGPAVGGDAGRPILAPDAARLRPTGRDGTSLDYGRVLQRLLRAISGQDRGGCAVSDGHPARRRDQDLWFGNLPDDAADLVRGGHGHALGAALSRRLRIRDDPPGERNVGPAAARPRY